MSFKKYLTGRSKGCVRGQSIMEYIIIFIVITLIAVGFVTQVQSDVFQPFFNATVSRILE